MINRMFGRRVSLRCALAGKPAQTRIATIAATIRSGFLADVLIIISSDGLILPPRIGFCSIRALDVYVKPVIGLLNNQWNQRAGKGSSVRSDLTSNSGQSCVLAFGNDKFPHPRG
jgi:hypothetical protein